MKKQLLTAAVGAAIAATSMTASMTANAGVKVFGSAQFEIGTKTTSKEVDNAAGVATADTSKFSSTLEDKQRGRFGIKASEDLGFGLKGLAHLEFDTNGEGDDTGNVSKAQDAAGKGYKNCGGLGCGSGERQIWAGIKGKFGLVSGGSHHGIYKTFGGVKWDPLTATFLEARNSNAMSGGRYGHNNFLDRSLRYMSPKFAGITVGVIRQFDYEDKKNNLASTAPVNETDGVRQNSSWQVGLKGKWGMTEAIAVYGEETQQKNVPVTTAPKAIDNSTRFKVGARFTFAKVHKVAVQYEIINNRQSSDRVETHGYVNWVGKFGSIMPQIGLGIYAANNENVVGTNDWNDKAGTFFQAAVSWRPSKTFRVFGGLRQQSSVQQDYNRVSEIDTNETTTTELTYSVGIRKDF